ncbi:MAG: hypothetical protein M1343_02975 [Chloroflexi bacterium]|nr:hypothetical protein [Chloroflexota bacterium]
MTRTIDHYIYDHKTGTPCQGVSAECFRTDTGASVATATSDSTGKIEFTGLDDTLLYRVVAKKPGDIRVWDERETLPVGYWKDWTPTVDQGGNVPVTVNEAKYCIVGKVCHIYGKVTANGVGVAGSAIMIGGIPAAAQPALGNIAIGTGHVQDTGVANYWGILWVTGTSFAVQDTNTRVAIGASPSVAFSNAGSADVLDFSATYRVP